MELWILSHEPQFRSIAFFGILLIMAIAEIVFPRRKLTQKKTIRWFNNLTLVVTNTLVLRFLMPVLAVQAAGYVAERGWGLLNQVHLPAGVGLISALLLLDLAIYLQHVMVHALPLLWRLHRMHHADLDFDVTNGARFHPLEILLSMLIKLMVVVLLGPSPLAVICFEVILNGTAMFNHANLKLPLRLDAFLRLWVVTPDMHRVHHSSAKVETNSNYGFSSPWWDYLFGTYRAQPALGHQEMQIGIDQFRFERELWLDKMLTQPFRGQSGIYPINRG